MKLREWLKTNRIKGYEFANRIGVSPPTISEYCAGQAWPSRDKMEAIARETNGEVTANDFVGMEAAG